MADGMSPARDGGALAVSTRRAEPRSQRSADVEPVRPVAVRWMIPHRIVAAAAAAIVLVATLGIVAGTAVGGLRGGFRQIGRDAGPEVVAASDLYFALNDMDAQAANVLMIGDERGLGVGRASALVIYEQRRRQADDDVRQASAIADTGATGRQALRRVLDGLGRYEALMAEAILLDGQAHHAAGMVPPNAVAKYRQATDLLKAQVLPAADSLTTSSAAVLDHAYQIRRAGARDAEMWTAILGAALLAVLAGLQWFLTRRFRRLVNPALVLASAAAVLLTILGVRLFGAEAEHLRVAKKDAFDSVLALVRMRAIGYDANADESRYLVDPARANHYRQTFLDKSQQVLRLDGATLATYDTDLAQAVGAYRADHSDLRFHGFLGTEFRNITFPGERAAAEHTLTLYQAYERDDRRMRALADSGRLHEAIRFNTSYAPGNSNHDFGAYDKSLAALIAINHDAFDSAIRDGEHALGDWDLIPPAAVVLVVALVVAGIWPRLAEYR
jgi:hypothetical protein